MSDYQPDKAGHYEVPPPPGYADETGSHGAPSSPGDYYPSYGWHPDERRAQGQNEQQRVGMHSESHDSSRIYMAGRDQYIKQPRDFSGLWKKVKKKTDTTFEVICGGFCLWAACSYYGLGPSIQPFYNWVQGLPGISHYFNK